MNKYQPSSLSNLHWSEYNSALEELYSACLLCTTVMKRHSRNVMLKHEATLNEYSEERMKNYNTVSGTKSKPVPSMYHPLFENCKILSSNNIL